MKTEYQISGMRENGGLHEMVTEVPSLVAVKSPTADSGPNNNINYETLPIITIPTLNPQ